VTSLLKQHEKQVQINLATSRKIEKIKSLRSLTRLLGKLNFRMFITDHDEELRQRRLLNRVSPRPPLLHGKSYGIGLRDAKDIVEGYLSRNPHRI
jgi:hypothetical protein